jgi:CheY-like chemotaxis protein
MSRGCRIALDLIEKHIDEISLVITDIRDAQYDGFELTSMIKNMLDSASPCDCTYYNGER